MTRSHRQEDYLNQGQQDDYFDEDLATAGHAPQTPVAEPEVIQDEYRDQGQQNGHFDEDLAVSDRSHRLPEQIPVAP